MTYKQVQGYLDSFINYEKKPPAAYGRLIKLARMRRLLEVSAVDPAGLKTIHIAGTKGKGSTAQFCAHILAAAGNQAGLYTSPHFWDFRERIQSVVGRWPLVVSRKISKKDVARIVTGLKPALEILKKDKKLGPPTFFEVYTAMAFKYFIERVDWAVIETGMGGRLDATNVVNPRVAVITHIGYDHTQVLGNTLEKIAREKAGIIKPGVPLVCAPQRSSVIKVIREVCGKRNAPMFVLGRDFRAVNVRLGREITRFDFIGFGRRLKDLRIGLRGVCQVQNACLSVAACILSAPPDLTDEVLRSGLAGARLPGRFETISRDPLVVVDVAHNPSSFSVLQENIKRYYPGKKIILVFAASRDKDVAGMLRQLKYDRLILTGFKSSRSFQPQEIAGRCRIVNVMIEPDAANALKRAKEFYGKNSLILVSGSLFLAAEVKQIVRRGCYARI